MSTRWFGVVSIVAALTWAGPVAAKDHGRGHGNGHGKVEKTEKAVRGAHAEKRHESETARPRIVGTRGVTAPRRRVIAEPVVVIDRDGHRRVITEYFSGESLPPGLAKRQSLPPGLQKRLVPVPAPLISRLPAVPAYYDRYFVGRDLVVVDRRTNTVVAIVPDVVVLRR